MSSTVSVETMSGHRSSAAAGLWTSTQIGAETLDQGVEANISSVEQHWTGLAMAGLHDCAPQHRLALRPAASAETLRVPLGPAGFTDRAMREMGVVSSSSSEGIVASFNGVAAGAASTASRIVDVRSSSLSSSTSSKMAKTMRKTRRDE